MPDVWNIFSKQKKKKRLNKKNTILIKKGATILTFVNISRVGLPPLFVFYIYFNYIDERNYLYTYIYNKYMIATQRRILSDPYSWKQDLGGLPAV